MITNDDIVIEHVPEDESLRAHAERTAEYYANTWQSGRPLSEKVTDIVRGKVAERAIETYLEHIS